MGASCRGPVVIVVAPAIALALAACGDDDVLPPDAGIDGGPPVVDGGELDAEARFGPTADPALPIFTPCPAGWREVPGESPAEPTVCEPWPESGPASCGPGELHLPGTEGCEPIAPACPSSGFPEDLLPSATVLYVRTGETGGDGAITSPFGTIGEAVLAAPAGAVIAIAPGLYVESIAIDKPLTLRGACGEVIVRGTSLGGAISVRRAIDVAIERLTVEGNEGIWVSNESAVTLDSLEVRNVDGLCLRSASSTVTGRRLALRDCDAGLAPANGTIDVREVVLERIGSDPMRLGGGTAILTDAAIRDLDAAEGELLFLSDGHVEMRRVVVEATVGEELIASNPEASVVLEDFVFRGPPLDVPSAPNMFLAFSGAELTLSRVRLERIRELGMAVAYASSRLTANDVLIRDVVGPVASMTGAGHGLEIGAGANAEIDRFAIVRATAFALLVDEAGTTANMRDVVVLGTRADNTTFYGRALQVQNGAVASVERALFSESQEVAVVAAGASTRLTLADTVVAATRARPCDAPCNGLGVGIGSYLSASLTAERFRVRGSPLAGIQIAVDGEIDLVDGEVIENVIGANVQVPDYDYTRLTEGVSYRDNETNLDATTLPVPEPMARGTMP